MELWLFGVRWPDACNWFKSFKLRFSQKQAKMLSEWYIVPATSDRMRLFPGEIPSSFYTSRSTKLSTAETPENDHPKCQELVVA